MPGVPDPLYVRARAGLLDAVEALGVHRESVVLVGAQAIYLHTGDADLAVAEYTTDADFALSPGDLADAPLLGDLLGARGFTPRQDPGGWLSPDGIYIDPMVPETLAGPGRRGAMLGPHGRRTARRAKGLEGAGSIATGEPSHLWMRPTRGQQQSGSLVPAPSSSPTSTRSASASAGKTACGTRTLSTFCVSYEPSNPRTWRIAFARWLGRLSADVTAEALELLPALFGEPDGEGVLMAVRAAGQAENPATIAGSLMALVHELLR